MPKEYFNYPQPTAYAYVEGTEPPKPDPAPSQVGIHWDATHGTVQLSLDIDWELLQRIVDQRREHGEGYFIGDSPDRQTFYTEALRRDDLQRTIKATRRARDQVFGADA